MRGLALELLLIRHGESTGNVGNLIASPDAPLTPLGIRQAQALGKRLAGEGWEPQRCFASPLARARETAEVIAECMALPPFETLDDLAELSVGPWGGTPWEDFARRHPELVVDNGNPLGMEWGYPGGETLAQVRERGARALRFLASFGETDDRPVIAIAHGTLLTQALSGFLNLPPSPYTQFSWRNAALAIVFMSDGRPPKITRLNDVQHLDCLTEG